MPQTVTLTPQDYTSILAMLNHEGANGITALLNNGSNADALGYAGGLIDVWSNRAASRGIAPWQAMNLPNQITDWDPTPSAIQAKANSLDPRIKALADAYLSERASGGQAIAPSAGFYLNTQLVKATPSYGTKYKDWYDPGTVEAAFGDTRNGGRSSLQTEFVANPDEYNVPQYNLALDPSLKLAPTADATSAYNQLTYRSNPISADPNHWYNAGFGGYLNADPTASIGGAPAPTSTGAGPNFGSLYGITPTPVVNSTDFGNGYDVSGNPYGATGIQAQQPIDIGAIGTTIPTANLGMGVPSLPSLSEVPTPQGGPFAAPNIDISGVGNLPRINPLITDRSFADGSAPKGFDAATYLRLNPDVAAVAQQQGLDPLAYAQQHYLNNGIFEGRQFAPGESLNIASFDPQAYLRANQDVAQVAQQQHLDPISYALQHYVDYGIGEGRGFSQANVSQGAGATGNGDFSLYGYLNSNPDVLKAAQSSGQSLPQFALGPVVT